VEIATLLDRPEERRARGEALRARAVAEYSWEQAGRQLETIYRELLARQSPGLDEPAMMNETARGRP
jgi:glycosyltransferase involved in cell wall biosynthesis